MLYKISLVTRVINTKQMMVSTVQGMISGKQRAIEIAQELKKHTGLLYVVQTQKIIRA